MLWIKAFHIIAVICWFAGIFYLPRLFVYHAMSQDQISKDRFVIMEGKLLKAIMNPSAILSMVLGAYMLISNWQLYQNEIWMHIKLVMVFLLIIFHGYCIYFAKQFAEGSNQHSDRFYRVFNEIPVPILIIIIIMVVIRPF
jgi:protoporphyrinogen IX oxidase